MSPTLQSALMTARQRAAAIGDTWVIPAVRDPTRPCPKGTLDKAFCHAAARAGVALPPRARWHSIRRKFATELKHMALKDLCYLGGWKDPKTLLSCYQQPDEEVMRRGLAQRRAFGISVV